MIGMTIGPIHNFLINKQWTIPLAVRCKTEGCVRCIAEIAGSNPAEVMDVRLLCLLCVVQVAVCATG
jgi:putative flippase GtrA